MTPELPLNLLLPASPGLAEARAGAARLEAFLRRTERAASVEVAESYAELEQRLLAGEATMGWAPPVVSARLELHGARPLFRFVRRGSSAYASALLALEGVEPPVEVTSPGLRVAWVDRDSTGGHLVPRAWLLEQVPGRALGEERFAGSHAAALDALLRGEVDLAATLAMPCDDGGVRLPALEARPEAERARCRVVGVTGVIPNDGLVLCPQAAPESQRKLRAEIRALLLEEEGRELVRSIFAADELEPLEPGSYQSLYSLVLRSFGLAKAGASCRACGHSLSSEARFCERCGTAVKRGPAAELAPLPVTSAPTWEEERKLATVLFADLAGFTRISSQLDPEAVRDFANTCLAPLREAVERHGGIVVKYLGDALMAVFGVPRADESDARRAVRAGLDMCRAMEALSAELAPRYGGPIGVRVGINTGQVMVGGVGAATRVLDVMGGAVNLASRIEGAAKPGEVLVGPATYRLSERELAFEPLGSLSFKGVPTPTAVYRALGPRRQPREATSVRSMDSSVLARHRELQLLHGAFEQVCVTSCGRAVRLVSEPGLGLGWLLRAAAARIREDARKPIVLYGTASSSTAVGGPPPLALVAQLLQRHFRVEAEASTEDARARVEEALLAPFAVHDVEAREAASLLAHLTREGRPSDGGVHFLHSRALAGEERLLSAFVQWVLALSEHQPVALVLRDLQWADSASLAVVERLFWASERHPVLLLLGVRPEPSKDWLTAAEESGRCDRIELRPLEPEVMRAFLKRLLAPLEDPPEALIEALLQRAEGSPECAKEIVRFLVDQGAIVVGAEGEPWRYLPQRVSPLQLPASVQGALQARLDRLSDEERTALKRAAVIGRTFRVSTLEAVVERLDGVRRPLLSLVEPLVERRLLTRGEGDAFSFRAQALRDIAYDSLPRDARGPIHAAIAEVLLDEGKPILGQGAAVLAGHLEASGQLAPAAGYFLVAARHAAEGEANLEAVSFFERALRYGEHAAREGEGATLVPREGVLRELAAALARVGRFEDALRRLDEAERALSSVPESVQAEAAALELERAWVLKDQGRSEDALASLERAHAALEGEGHGLTRLLVLAERAFLRAQRGALEAASADADEGKRIAEVLENTPAPARESLLAVAKLYDTLAFVELRRGAYDAAERAFLAAEARRERAGDGRGRLVRAINLGGLAFLRGDMQAARASFREALEAAEKGRRIKDVALCAANLGQAELALGELEPAERHLERGQRLGEEHQLLDVLADSTRARADLRLARGAYEEALPLALEAVVHAERTGDLAFKVAAHTSAMRALLGPEDERPSPAERDAAHEHLAAALSMLRATGSERDEEQARALEEELARRLG